MWWGVWKAILDNNQLQLLCLELTHLLLICFLFGFLVQILEMPQFSSKSLPHTACYHSQSLFSGFIGFFFFFPFIFISWRRITLHYLAWFAGSMDHGCRKVDWLLPSSCQGPHLRWIKLCGASPGQKSRAFLLCSQQIYIPVFYMVFIHCTVIFFVPTRSWIL